MEGKTQMEIFEKAACRLYNIIDDLCNISITTNWTTYNLLVEEGEATLKVLENSWKVGSGMFDPDHAEDSQNWFDATFTKKFKVWKNQIRLELIEKTGEVK